MPGPVHIGRDESAAETVETSEGRRESESGWPVTYSHGGDFSRSLKPVIALGITSIRAYIHDLVIKILENFQVPAVLTPMAKGMVPESHPCYAGVLAHALGDQVGVTHQQADLVVGLGFDPVELNYEDWVPNAPLIHIDTTPANLDLKNYSLACDVVGELRYSLEHLLGEECSEKRWDINSLINRKEEMFKR